MSFRRNLRSAVAAVTVVAVATLGLPAGASASAGFTAAGITVTRDSDLHVVPGEIGNIGFTVRPPKTAKIKSVGFSVPLTGLPAGFQILSMKQGLVNDCQVDQVAQRAWCTDVEIFESGVGIVTLAMYIAADAPRDLDWSEVPVTISTASSAAASIQDFASTRPCDDPPVPNRTDLRLEPFNAHEYGRNNGRRIPICGSLSGPGRGAKVTVEFRAVGSATWEVLTVVTTKGAGYSWFCKDFYQRINGKVRLRFDGDADYPAASVQATMPDIAAGLTGWVTKGTSKLGQTITMTPTVVPSPRKVLLQWRTPAHKEWKTVQTVTSPANGRITLRFKPPAKGKYWLRAYPLGDAKAGWSNGVVRVQQVT